MVDAGEEALRCIFLLPVSSECERAPSLRCDALSGKLHW
jgi:hypothetical protein